MSINDPKYQEMYLLLVEQLLLRPETVIANLNALVHEHNINIELKLLRSDPCKLHWEKKDHPDPYMFPFVSGERMVATV